VVVAFNPLHKKVQRIVDRGFYRIKLDYKSTVVDISNDLTSFLNMDEIIVRIIHAVRDIMAIDSAGIILLDPENDECLTRFIHDGPGVDGAEEYSDDCFDLDYPLAVLMKKEKKVLTLYDIERALELEKEQETAQLMAKCVQNFNALRGVAALPLVHQDEVKGLLVLGRKKSGRFYAVEDIDLLTTLANQGAIAIENARMAEKMKNEELKKARLARYLSPQVVGQVSDMDFEGERKNVAVLISDIRDFTDLTRTQPPDSLVAILNEYRTEMVRIIFEHKGSLDKYVGDAIVAVFGGFVELDNPTSNAVITAIDMVSRMVRLNEKWKGQYRGFQMNVGFGIDTGEVFMGNVGSPERMEFTVIGEAVNMADHLSNLARPNQILLSETASKALGGHVDIREVEDKRGEKRVLEVVR
jgi:adenylate cyclase